MYIPVEIKPNGKYCDSCKLIRRKADGSAYCVACDVDLWTCGALVQRCDECMAKAAEELGRRWR